MTVVEFPQIMKRGRGPDVPRDRVEASILSKELLEERQSFQTFIPDLERLICRLQNHGITHRGAGVYWKPVYFVLEGCFDSSGWRM